MQKRANSNGSKLRLAAMPQCMAEAHAKSRSCWIWEIKKKKSKILLRPKDYDVIATMNLNGDYISDALAACVGGIGIAPGANLSDEYAVFEATHGTAPKYAGQDKVNPGSLILSAEMMLRHMGWTEAADLIISAMEKTILAKKVTYDFERMMDGADLVSCSGFGEEMVKRM